MGNRTALYTYTFDAVNRMQSMKDSFHGSATYAYDAVGNRTELHLAPNVSVGTQNQPVIGR